MSDNTPRCDWCKALCGWEPVKTDHGTFCSTKCMVAANKQRAAEDCAEYGHAAADERGRCRRCGLRLFGV